MIDFPPLFNTNLYQTGIQFCHLVVDFGCFIEAIDKLILSIESEPYDPVKFSSFVLESKHQKESFCNTFLEEFAC